MTHIVVSSNCQTDGIANALRLLFRGAKVSSFLLPWPIDKEEHLGFVAEKLSDADAWITIAQPAFIEKVADRLPRNNLQQFSDGYQEPGWYKFTRR